MVSMAASPWSNDKYRIIEFENKCDHPVGVVTTRAAGIKMCSDGLCDTELITNGVISTGGAKCNNYKQIISAIPPSGSNIYIEKLCKDVAGCNTDSSEYCSASVQLYPVKLLPDEFINPTNLSLTPSRKNEISIAANTTILQELTFGADPDKDKKATDDNFDASIIPPGVCSAHSNPFSNQYGYSLDNRGALNGNRGCVKPKNVAGSSFRPDVLKQISDFRNEDPLPDLYTGEFDGSIKDGKPACNSKIKTACNPDNSWVCGEPYEYTYNGNTYWLVKYSYPNVSNGQEWTIYKSKPDKGIMDKQHQKERIVQHTKLEVPAPLKNKIKKDIRENIYKCTLNTYLTLNTDKNINGYTTPIGSNFSTYDASVHDKSECAPMNCESSKYLDIFDKCRDPYWYQYDDFHGGRACKTPSRTISKDSISNPKQRQGITGSSITSPAYKVTYCPGDTDPQPNLCKTDPLPPHDSNATWINGPKGDPTKLTLTCKAGYTFIDPTDKDKITTQCTKIGKWTTNAKKITYCKQITPDPKPPKPDPKPPKPDPKPPKPDPKPPKPDPKPPKPSKPSKPFKHHKYHKGDSDTYTGKHPKYKAPDRSADLDERYQGVYDKWTTTEELSDLIDAFYKPNCSLHMDVPNDVLLKSPDMYDMLANPGQGHCFGKIKDIKKDIKHKRNKK